jgi:hypothetical protein
MDRLSMILRGFDPAHLLWRQDPPPGGAATPPPATPPPATPPPATPPPAETPPAETPPSNAEAAAKRVQAKLERERDAALAEAKTLREAQESDAQKTIRERDEALAERDRLRSENTAIKLESRIRAAATGKAHNPDAVVKLSADKLGELAEATDAELAAHVADVMTTYGLATGTGQPPPAGLPGTGPQGGATPPAAPTAAEATGDPVKDYRAGIGHGLLSIFGARSAAQNED